MPALQISLNAWFDNLLLSTVLPHLTQIILCLDQNNHIVALNATAEQFYGFRKAQLSGIHFINFCNQQGYPLPLFSFSELKYGPQLFTQTVKSQSGEKNTVLWKAVPFYEDFNNIFQGTLLIGTDVTQETQAEEGAKEMEQHLKLVIESITDNYWWKDLTGRYRGCNGQLAKQLGLSSINEIIGKTDYDMPWASIAGRLIENDKKIIESGQPKTYEEVVPIETGAWLTFLVTKAPLRNRHGSIIGTIGTSIDITQRKKMEEELRQAKEAAEAADQAKTEFLQNMRHDIRTPLSGIIGVAELFKQNAQDPQQQELADILSESSQVLLDFLNRILEVVNFNTGELPLFRKKFNLRKLIEEVIALNRAKALEKHLTLDLQYDETLPIYFIGGVIRLQRIVLELVANALNFTKSGFVTVKIQKAKQEERHYVLKISVIDTGIGIPENKQQEIYTRFRRLTSSYQGVYKGTGLGLSIIKEFVDDLDGELYVESQPNQGSHFYCLLPLNAALLDSPEGAEG